MNKVFGIRLEFMIIGCVSVMAFGLKKNVNDGQSRVAESSLKTPERRNRKLAFMDTNVAFIYKLTMYPNTTLNPLE